MSGDGIGIDEACAELATPTGDPDIDTLRLAYAENIRQGYLAPSGRDRNGRINVKLTEAGKKLVKGLG